MDNCQCTVTLVVYGFYRWAISNFTLCQCTVTLVVYCFYRWAISNLQVTNSPAVKAINHECDRTLTITLAMQVKRWISEYVKARWLLHALN